MSWFLGLILSIVTLGSAYVVPTGHVGVITQFGDVKYVTQQGIHFKSPVGIQSVTKIDTRVQKADVEAEAGSKDLQTVKTDIVVNFHVDRGNAGKLYQEVGPYLEEKIIDPAVSEVVKASVAKKTAEEILTKRTELKADIDKELKRRLAKYYIVLDDVSVTNVDFSREFNAAIEAKQVAEQQAKQARFTAEKAEKDAEAIVNRAKGEAEAQRLQQQTLSPELLQKMAIERWNGQLPQYTAGQSGALFNIPIQ